MRSALRSLFAAAVLPLSLFSGIQFAANSAQAQSAKAVAASTRVLQQVDPSDVVTLKGHLPPWANSGNDLGAVQADLHLDNLHLILTRAPDVQASFDQLLADLYNPASPRFHQWLTPQQNAEQYGVAPADLAAVKTWLQSQGLSVDDVAAGGVFITFSGTASAVETAFGTKLHNFSHSDLALRAPTSEPTVPAAIANVILAIGGLDDNRMKPANVHHALDVDPTKTPAGGAAQPFYTSTSGNHYLAPGDWNIIYDVASVLKSGTVGSGKVMVLDYGRVASADITYFETYFGLNTSALPNTILLAGSADPGYDGINGWQAEGSLDVERIYGTAPGVNIDYYIAATSSYSNTFSQLQTNISTYNDPIVSMSFGSCESTSSGTTVSGFDSYFKTGAAQGIGNYVSSGDTGAAGCDSNGSAAPATQHLAPNVVCSSAYATCVGGTEFAEGSSTYWSPTTDSTYKTSVLSYIPEGAWNEPSTTNSSGVTSYAPAASGGGVSAIVTKPTFQTGVGVPADGYRDTPDVAFTSAGGHDGYLVYVTSGLYVFGGTSAAAPSMAGVAALLNQKKGAAQGNINPLLYSLAASTTNVFHDTTIASSGITTCSAATPSICNNSTPAPAALLGGQAGYVLTTGYDQVTGLGTIDVANLLAAASPVTTTLAVTAAPSPGTANVPVTLTATLTPGTSSATPTGTVQFLSNGVNLGSAVTISGNKATLSNTYITAGTYAITAVYSGDSNFATSTAAAYSLTINAGPSITVTPATTALTLVSGATTGNTVNVAVTSVNAFTGAVALTCTVTKPTSTDNAAGTCSVAPTPTTLTSGGTNTVVLTIATTVGTSGVLNVTVTGTSGSTVITSAPVVVTLKPASFSITPTVSSLTVASGATTGNTTNVTVTSINAFAGSVALTCKPDTLVPPQTSSNTNCAFNPATVTLTNGGSAVSVLTLTTEKGAGGSFNGILNGNGTTTGATVASTGSGTLPIIVTGTYGLTEAVATPASTAVVSGTTVNYAVTVTSVNGYAGPVTVSCTPSPTFTGTAAASCTSQTVTLTANGTAVATVPVATTVGTAGTVIPSFTATGTATGASFTTTSSAAVGATVTLAAAGFTLAPSPASLSFTSGATTGNTDTVTLTSTNAFTGAVTLSCSITSSSAANQPTCTVTQPAALTANGTATAVVTIGSVTAHAKVTSVAGLTNGLKAGGAVFALLLCLVPFRRRKAIRPLMALIALFGTLTVVSGCGGGGDAPKVLSSSAGSYTVTVTGTGTTTGASVSNTASTTFALTIN